MFLVLSRDVLGLYMVHEFDPPVVNSLIDTPLITVITSTFNAVGQLPFTLESIRSQSYDCLEYIVIDGGSSDGTAKLLQDNADIIDYWISEPDSGIYEAWNKGVAQARGSWILFLGAGDQLHEGWLDEVASASLDNDLVYGDLEIVGGERFDHVYARIKGTPWEAARSILPYRMILYHPGMAHNARLFIDESYDDSLKIVGDWEFFQRAKIKKVKYVQGRVQSRMVMGGVTTSAANMRRHFYEWMFVLDKYKLKPPIVQSFKWRLKIAICNFPFLYDCIQRLVWLTR